MPGLNIPEWLSPLARGTHIRGMQPVRPARFIPAGAGNSIFIISSGVSFTVYPRWRGELSMTERLKFHQPGLSPLARGTRSPCTPLSFNIRFIPAGAGNSILAFQLVRRDAVYPRWRGELSYQKVVRSFECGLSPLARGTLHWLSVWTMRSRFIPAGAGNSLNITYY